MVRQMLFLDPPDHTRLRALASAAFTRAEWKKLRSHIQEVMDTLLDAVVSKGSMDVMSDFAGPAPAIVTAELLGVPAGDHAQLREWSQDFAEMLGNFQHNPERFPRVLRSVENLCSYFRSEMQEQQTCPRDGLVQAMMTAEIDGTRLSEEEVIANLIVTMVGGQETTTNLHWHGVLTLLRHPAELARLRADSSLIPSAVEELLRYESPSQHTARLAPADVELGGRRIRKRQAVIAVMGAGNRDPERFPEPDLLDITRKDNRHLAFGWAAHFCFGAALARLEGQIAFDTILRRLPQLKLNAQGPWCGVIISACGTYFTANCVCCERPKRATAFLRPKDGMKMAVEYSDAKRKLLKKYFRGEVGVRRAVQEIPDASRGNCSFVVLARTGLATLSTCPRSSTL